MSVDPPAGRLRRLAGACVACGKCQSECPRFAASGHELDSPRGRLQLLRWSLADVWPDWAAAAAGCRMCGCCQVACPVGLPVLDVWARCRRVAGRVDVGAARRRAPGHPVRQRLAVWWRRRPVRRLLRLSGRPPAGWLPPPAGPAARLVLVADARSRADQPGVLARLVGWARRVDGAAGRVDWRGPDPVAGWWDGRSAAQLRRWFQRQLPHWPPGAVPLFASPDLAWLYDRLCPDGPRPVGGPSPGEPGVGAVAWPPVLPRLLTDRPAFPAGWGGLRGEGLVRTAPALARRAAAQAVEQLIGRRPTRVVVASPWTWGWLLPALGPVPPLPIVPRHLVPGGEVDPASP